MEPMPNVLLVEDDPTSCIVLSAALERCGVDFETAGCVRDALYAASPARHALWLIDAHLPDGSGIALLQALRRIDPDAVAIAHTASVDPHLHGTLRSAGFADVLVKPLAAADVAAMLRRWLPALGHAVTAQPVPVDGPCQPGVWDDAAALRALAGNATHVGVMRSLFVAELPGVLHRVTNAVRGGDAAALHSELHRLHAGCGFVGAQRLASAVHQLGVRADDAALARFEQAARAVLSTAADVQSA